ncbi:MAG: MmgE/PrpD family protein [Dehalococcoidia bacterium]
METIEPQATRALVDSVAGITLEDAPDAARMVARHCVLDWLGCALGGSREPLSQILIQEIAFREPGDGTLVGRSERATLLTAALVNGAMGHALDFDDTHWLMNGHPSAPVVPAVLALAEREGCDGEAFLASLIAGIEFECRLGALIGGPHYAAGFHATGTLGTFGAAAAASHLLGLNRDAWCHAIGLAGTQAAGLKSGFGTMAKPLHAGRAASNGLLAALLARGGFTGNQAIIETAQGFAANHAGGAIDPSRLARIGEQWLITQTLFKYHASCYLTHAPIEAASRLRADGLRVQDIDSVEVRGSMTCVGVCDIPEPTTGLEGKFSLRATTAMALLGDDTSDPATFSDQRMREPDLIALRDRIAFVPQPGLAATRATVVVRSDGRELSAEADTGQPSTDLDAQWDKLSAKFFALAEPVVGPDNARALHRMIAGIEGVPSVRDLMQLAQPVVRA